MALSRTNTKQSKRKIRNTVVDCGTHLECLLTQGHRLKIDIDDAAWLKRYKVSYNAGQARVRHEGQRRRLSSLMLRETTTRVVVHLNGDTLDLRRANLRLDYPGKRRITGKALPRNNTSGSVGVGERRYATRNGTMQTRFVVQWYEHTPDPQRKSNLRSRTFTYHGAEDRERARQEAIAFRATLNV